MKKNTPRTSHHYLGQKAYKAMFDNVQDKKVDVAIIGAGSAGLSALEEVRKVTQEYIVVDNGPLGTMCARVGCMPSKILIQVANEYARCSHLESLGIHGGKNIRINIPEVLCYVRKLRDQFTRGVIQSTQRLGNHLVRGRAFLIGPQNIRIGKSEFFAKKIILATGSRPVIPKKFREFGHRLLTTDSLFEMADLPQKIGFIGLGSIGLEIGQALSRLGCDVIAFDRSRGVGEITDPSINSYASRHFAKEFEIHFNREVKLKASSKKIEIVDRERSYARDVIVASLGRRTNLDLIGLDGIGISLDKEGLPKFNRETMKLSGFPIYIAGDARSGRLILHEAADDGRIAGYNSVHFNPRCFKRRVPLSIVFGTPNLVMVGKSFAELKRGSFVIGEVNFETQARSLILRENCGMLHIYANAVNGDFLGAEMIGPAGEHLAHLMAWALEQNLTIFEMLRMPFYHPVVEEGLRTALRDAARKVKCANKKIDIAFCN